MTKTPTRRDMLAAEYVLGLLPPEDAAAAKARIARDPGFRAQIAAWQEILEPLDATAPPVLPPDHLFTHILDRLEDTGAKTGGAGHAQPRAGPAGLRAWLAQIADWPKPALAACAGALSLAAICLALALTTLSGPRPQNALPLVAFLRQEAGSGAAVALVREAPPQLLLHIHDLPQETGRVPQLWLLTPGVEQPVSLGVLAVSAAPQEIALADVAVKAGGLLLISLERREGAPYPLPEGPVVASGVLEAFQSAP